MNVEGNPLENNGVIPPDFSEPKREDLTQEDLERFKEELKTKFGAQYYQAFLDKIESIWQLILQSDPDFHDGTAAVKEKLFFATCWEHVSFINDIESNIEDAYMEQTLEILKKKPEQELSFEEAQSLVNTFVAPINRLYRFGEKENLNLQEYLQEYYSFSPGLHFNIHFDDLDFLQKAWAYLDFIEESQGSSVADELKKDAQRLHSESQYFFQNNAIPVLTINYYGEEFKIPFFGVKRGNKSIGGTFKTSIAEGGYRFSVGYIGVATGIKIRAGRTLPQNFSSVMHEIDHSVRSIVNNGTRQKSAISEGLSTRAEVIFSRNNLDIDIAGLERNIAARKLLVRYPEADSEGHCTGTILAEILAEDEELFKKMFANSNLNPEIIESMKEAIKVAAEDDLPFYEQMDKYLD
jgi:hypothetical protein